MQQRTLKKLIFHDLNLSKQIANHLVGEQHKPHHRFVIGGGIIVIGVVVKSLIHDPAPLAFLIELFGRITDGIGIIPFAEHVLKMRIGENQIDKE